MWEIGNPEFECDATCPDHRVWPWNGHRLFAYDLVRFIKPARIVELGTYWGTSFFSFCQAAKDQQLGVECVAVDTWAGDDHTGSYENTVFETVERTIASYYQNVNTRLIRSLFDEALAEIEDGSIDILHIDGCHNYQAVKSDYHSWLPKLKANGIILFHDIADSCDYGSVKFWHELREQYPGFSFQHSWGLGVLFPVGDEKYKILQENDIDEKIRYYASISELNLVNIMHEAQVEISAQQDALIKHQEQVIAELSDKTQKLQLSLDNIYRSTAWNLLKKLRIVSKG